MCTGMEELDCEHRSKCNGIPAWAPPHPSYVQYMGIPKISDPCLLAVDTIVNSERPPERASLVTWVTVPRSRQSDHLFLFWDWNEVPLTVVHSGFASGYSGIAPRAFSMALCMIRDKAIPISELRVQEGLFNALEERRPTQAMLDQLCIQGEPMEQWIWAYVWERHEQMVEERTFWPMWHQPNLVFDFLDPELAERCQSLYPANVDAAVREAFLVVEARLHGLIEASIEDSEALTGLALVTAALRPNGGILTDESLRPSEREGLHHLFRGAFQYVRNPRAHRFVDEEDPQRAIEFIYLADLLLRCLPSAPPAPEPQQHPTP